MLSKHTNARRHSHGLPSCSPLEAFTRGRMCQICYVLKHGFDGYPQGIVISLIDANSCAERSCPACGLVIKMLRFHLPDLDTQDVILQPRFFHGSLNVFEESKKLNSSRPPWLRKNIEIFRHPGNHCPWSGIRAATSVTGDTGSEEGIACARSWLDRCRDQHDKCAGNISAHLPTRLLRICGPNEVKLHISNGESGQYVCLSHCWGKSEILKTTFSTIDIHQTYIEWERLSKTFQEAISFAYRLGFTYIWIDSLCIVQDSDGDWHKEGSKMDMIYRNASLTLAATRSPDSSGGCFNAPPSEHLSHKWSFIGQDNQQYELHSRKPLDHSAFSHELLPLMTRGWVLQERILSQRILYFTDNELVWECMELLTCECSQVVYNLERSVGIKVEVSRHEAQATREAIDHRWRKLVSLYSAMSLTFPKDIFPALQGLAKTVPSKMGMYLAGLWSETLVSGLCWCSTFPRPRPKDWRAPTWSWASTGGLVAWVRVFDVTAQITRFITVLRATTTPKGSDITGELVAGELHIRGRILKGKVHYNAPHVHKYVASYLVECTIAMDIFLGNQWLTLRTDNWIQLCRDYDFKADGLYRILPNTEVFVVKIEGSLSGTLHQTERSATWLILTKSTGAMDAYERIGLLQVQAYSGKVEQELILDQMDQAYESQPEVEIKII